MKMHRILTAASLAGILSVVQSPVVGTAADEPPTPQTAATNPYIERTTLDQLKRMKAPETIDAMLPFLEKASGIRFASADLLFSDPYAVLTKGLSSAVGMGSDLVQGVPCEHLAFRAPGVNWEIWVESGARALPRRLVITYTNVTNFPRSLVEFSHWNLHPWLTNSAFNFKKPAGAKEIAFLPELKAEARQIE